MRAILLLAIPAVLSGQSFSGRYAPLIRALSLSDAQIAQLQQPLPAPPRPVPTGGRVAMYSGIRALPVPAAPARAGVLDDVQRAKLAGIEKEYNDLRMRAGAIVLGMIDKAKWDGGFLCYGAVRGYMPTFDLTEEQAQQIAAHPGLVRAVLSETQKVKIAAFEANLELGLQAIELHLMTQPIWGEVLCP